MSQITSYVLLAFTLLLSACGNHAILEVSDVEGEFATNQNPIGLIEAQDLSPESSFGFSLRYPYQEHIYCGAFLQENGEIITNSDCIQNNGRIAAPEGIRLILRNPGLDQEEFEIEKILINQNDSRNNWAILIPKERAYILNKYGSLSIAETLPETNELKNGVSTNLFSVDKPDRSGIAKLRKFPAKLDTKPAWDKCERKAIAENKIKNPKLDEQELKSISSQLTESFLKNSLADSQLIPAIYPANKISAGGGVMLSGGKVVGILSAPNSKANGKAHWLPGSLKKIPKTTLANPADTLPTNEKGDGWIDF
jgi:hypothetical protein